MMTGPSSFAHRLATMADLAESLDQDQPPFEVSALQYKLEHAAPAVMFDEMVEGFGEHVEAMRAIVAEGDQLFSKEH